MLLQYMPIKKQQFNCNKEVLVLLTIVLILMIYFIVHTVMLGSTALMFEYTVSKLLSVHLTVNSAQYTFPEQLNNSSSALVYSEQTALCASDSEFHLLGSTVYLPKAAQ